MRFNKRNAVFVSAFKEVQRAVHANAVQKGFWHANSDVGCKIALIHSELSEAIEYIRNGDGPDDKLPNRRGGEVELADAIIRIMDLAEYMRYDIAGALLAKHEFNRNRPPLHGKKF